MSINKNCLYSYQLFATYEVVTLLKDNERHRDL